MAYNILHKKYKAQSLFFFPCCMQIIRHFLIDKFTNYDYSILIFKLTYLEFKNRFMNQHNYFFNSHLLSPFQLIYQNVSVRIAQKYQLQAKRDRNILHSCSGKFQPKTSTAILGPSGCGKTTFLNCISGWTMQQNLETFGNLRINGQKTSNIKEFQNYISYVMQDTTMMNYFTVYQTFKFIADLRIFDKSFQQKQVIIEQLLQFLGLLQCKETVIGNNLERGISGGESKRTAIGLQLLKNPSIVFLDEPTTGLDSYSALQLIKFLQKLAKAGRTVVYTIHQPSSDIFNEFNKLILMAEGHIIYNGDAKSSIQYFRKKGIQIKQHTNPSDTYLKMLHKEGLMLEYQISNQAYTQQDIQYEFQKQINYLVSSYKKQEYSNNYIQNIITDQLSEKGKQNQLNLCRQFTIIIWRSWVGSYRNPYDLIMKLVQSIINSVIIAFVFAPSANSIERDFFSIFNQYCNKTCFDECLCVQLLKAYLYSRKIQQYLQTISLFFSKNSFKFTDIDILRHFLLEYLLLLCKFKQLFLFVFSQHYCSARSYVAMQFARFFLIHSFISNLDHFQCLWNSFNPSITFERIPDTISKFLFFSFKPWKYLSITKYGFQALIESQFTGQHLLFNGQTQTTITIDYFGIQSSYFLNIMLMLGIGIVFRILSFFWRQQKSARRKLNSLSNQKNNKYQLSSDYSPAQYA